MRRLILPAVTALLLWSPPAAMAEVAQRDGVRVSVAGTMTPSHLPRTGTAPVAVSPRRNAITA